jgi:hypothetical protein
VILVDGSRDTVGHVLAQFENGLLRPLIFGGRSLRKFERSDSVTHIELIALLDAIKSYHPFLSNGRQFLLLSDHVSLSFLQTLKLSSSPQLIRYSLFLQHFNFRIKHIRGSENFYVIFFPDILLFIPLQRKRQTAKRQTHNSLITSYQRSTSMIT